MVAERTGIVGGTFALAAPRDVARARRLFTERASGRFANARSAISTFLRIVSHPGTVRRVFVPSFLCDAVVAACAGSGALPQFYAVDSSLRPTRPPPASPGDVVVFIDYFGFRTGEALMDDLRRRGVWVLEDASHALLTSGVGDAADAVVFSPRKFVGVPDGGILVVTGDRRDELQTRVESESLVSPPTVWWETAYAASSLRREFDETGVDRGWFALFQRSESEQPIGPFAISGVSWNLLQNGFDYDNVASRRVRNYRELAAHLGDLALFEDLPAGIVPLGFPIRISGAGRRDHVRQALFAQKIYPAIHWPIAGVVPDQFAASHALSSEIMTVPCDQRYDEREMRRVGRLVREVM